MQHWFDTNGAMLGSILTLVLGGMLSAIFRNIPKNTWWVQVIRWILQSGWNYFQTGTETIHRSEVVERVTKAAMFVVCLTGLVSVLNLVTGCASTSASVVSAQSSNGKTWDPCVDLEFSITLPFVKNESLLVCASVETTLADAKQSAIDDFKRQHPDAKLVSETRLPKLSLEQWKAAHPSSKVVTQ